MGTATEAVNRDSPGVAIKVADDAVLREIETWFIECLGCVPGKREFTKHRYQVESIGDDEPERVKSAFDEFTLRLAGHRSVGCLFVFNNPAFYRSSGGTVIDAVRYLAKQMSPLTNVPVEELVNGGNLNRQITLKCPVTGVHLTYPDFDAVAFCPQAEHKTDPLYDPLMAAPYPCVNISSDIFGFSMFVRDICLKEYGCEVAELKEAARLCGLFSKCGMLWQHLARKTIKNYIATTDTGLCPVYMSSDEATWYAHHQDPAFAESKKELYVHHMPVSYTPVIISKWMAFFLQGLMPDYTAVTQPGEVA